MIAASLLTLPLALLGPQEEPNAEELVQQAWTLVPEYTGDHRPFLSAEDRSRTAAGAHLFAAAAELAPQHVRALWSLGHARILLAEDSRNRGYEQEALEHYADAVEALSRAIELTPNDPWSLYARGAAHAAFGRHTLALDDLDRAVGLMDETLAGPGDHGRVPWLRFKALEWRGEVLMRAGRYEEARAQLEAFHAEYSNNDWPLLIALAESHERERDLVGARARYEEAVEKFPNDHQALALLGYVAGLLGDRDEATRRLQQALEEELRPGMYTRLWLWILANDQARAAAEADLKGFLAHPPGDLTPWDVALGKFVTGEGDVEGFLETARAEEARRMEAGEVLDELMCEVWYYVGLRLENESAGVEDAEARAALRLRAFDAYRNALASTPVKWKWEWAFARLQLSELAAELDLQPGQSITLDGQRVSLGGVSGRLESASWHAPKSERAVSSLGREPRTGDLMMARVRRDDGLVVPVQAVIGTR